MRALFIILIFTGIHFNSSAHKYYFGFAEMEYNGFTQKFEATISFTAHDLEKSLKDQGMDIGDLSSLTEDQTKILAEYINKHFTVSNGDQNCNFDIIGSESMLNGIIHIYMESDEIRFTNTIDFRFDALMETYSEQQNKITLYYMDETYTVTFTSIEKIKTIQIENKQE